MDEDNRIPLIRDVEDAEAGCCCYNVCRDCCDCCSCNKWSNRDKFCVWVTIGMLLFSCGLGSVWYIGLPGADVATGVFFGSAVVIIIGSFIWGHYNLQRPSRTIYHEIE